MTRFLVWHKISSCKIGVLSFFLLDLGEEISDLAHSNTLAKNLLVIMPATVITAHRCEVSSFI